MSNVNNAASVGDPTLNVPPVVAQAAPVEPPVADIENAANFRLVIEEDAVSGSYIYKTLDRRTGEVIQQFPREDVLKLKDAQDYNAGSLVNARV
jgi:flagellar protein FlaG